MKNAQQDKRLFASFEEQIAAVNYAIKKKPDRKKNILTVFISNYYEAIKKTVRMQGHMMPHYFLLADTLEFNAFPVTNEAIQAARESNADAVVSVDGFQSDMDIGDIIYHVSMSAPCLGVLGWLFKVELHDGVANIIREMPYLFDSQNEVRSLGEMMEELERAS